MVLGGLGFCGSHLVDALKDAGHHVTVLDNCSQSAVMPVESRADTIHLDDLSNLSRYNQSHYDYVFHCASPAGPARIKPGYALRRIIEGTQLGLDFAARVGARFVKFSSSEVYGRSDVPLTESTPAIVSPAYDARSEYAIGFLAAECLCFNHPHPDVQLLRLFNVVGPRQSIASGCVLPRFCAQAKAGEPLTIFGDGQQRRTFTDVSDLVSFCLLLMEKWARTDLGKQIWNVANPANECTIQELAHLLCQSNAADGTLAYQYGPFLTEHYRDGVSKSNVDISKARSLGWEPKVGLREIIQKCLSLTPA
jgi:nucleoside-diphosphate-sugar epimerase